MEPIIVQAEPTAKEVNQACFEHRCNTVLVAPTIVLFVMPVMAELYGILGYRHFSIFDGNSGYVIMGLCAIFPFSIVFAYLSYEKNRDHTGGIEPISIQYVFNDEGVQLIDKQGTSFIRWCDISNGYDCVNSLAFAIGIVACVIPKRNFKDGEQLKSVRKLILDKVSQFTFTKGKRKDIPFENTYENFRNTTDGAESVVKGEKKSPLIVDVSLTGPEAAKVILKCKYEGPELSEFQWRYVTRQLATFRFIAYFCYFFLIFRLYLNFSNVELGIFEWIVPTLIAVICFGAYAYTKAQRFKTYPAFYCGRRRAVVEIGNDLVLFKAAALEASLKWNEITEVHETTRFFILKTLQNFLIIIPKLSLNSEYKSMFVTNLLRRKKIKGSKDATNF